MRTAGQARCAEDGDLDGVPPDRAKAQRPHDLPGQGGGGAGVDRGAQIAVEVDAGLPAGRAPVGDNGERRPVRSQRQAGPARPGSRFEISEALIPSYARS